MDSRDAWQLDGEDLKSEVLDLVRVRHELQSRMVLLIVEMFSREVLGGKGFRAIAQWLHGSTNLEIGECSLLVGLARLLMLEPVVGDAFHRGDVDALKARQVASFCQHPPKNMTLADVDKARGILLGLASKNIADCDAVRAAIRRIEKQYGTREDGVPVGEDSERNEFYASKGLYGRVTVKGDLDAVNGARLITLLSSLSAPTPEKDGVKDTRTPALRRADGFCELLRRYELRASGVGSDRGWGETAHHGHRQRQRHDRPESVEGSVAVDSGTGVRVDGLGGPDQYRHGSDAGLRLHGHPDLVG